MWKRYSNYEGGTADPMIVSWPEQITAPACAVSTPTPSTSCRRSTTASAIEPPEVVKGYTQFPLEGVSFAATFDDADATTGKQTQFYSMGGTRAIWHQGWKAAAVSPAAPDMWADYATQRWELFNTDERPHASATTWPAQHPEKLQELIALWWAQAGQYNALPLENRDAIEILTTERPAADQAAQPLRLLPRQRRGARVGRAEHPQPLLHDRGRGRPSTPRTPSGVLFAHGARFGGHALYIKDGKLKYVYNWVGDVEQIVESTEPLPTGHVVFSASFEREGDSMPAEGTLTLHVGEKAVGKGRIKTQPGKFSIAGEGLNVGKDGAEPVTDDYPGECALALHRRHDRASAAIDVSGEPFVDLAAEARMAFMRD